MEQEQERVKLYPEGHFVAKWMAIGIAVFAGFGIPLSFITGYHALIGIGPALGVPMGLAIGTSVEARYKKEGKIRPLTEDEKNGKRLKTKTGLSLIGLLFLTGFLVFLLVSCF